MGRVSALCLGVLVGCATTPPPPSAPPPEPISIGPFNTQKDCDLARMSNRFNAEMRNVELEKAVRGMADVTCYHFKLMPDAKGKITIAPDDAKKSFTADELFAEFVKAAAAVGVTVRQDGASWVVEPKR